MHYQLTRDRRETEIKIIFTCEGKDIGFLEDYELDRTYWLLAESYEKIATMVRITSSKVQSKGDLIERHEFEVTCLKGYEGWLEVIFTVTPYMLMPKNNPFGFRIIKRNLRQNEKDNRNTHFTSNDRRPFRVL